MGTKLWLDIQFSFSLHAGRVDNQSSWLFDTTSWCHFLVAGARSHRVRNEGQALGVVFDEQPAQLAQQSRACDRWRVARSRTRQDGRHAETHLQLPASARETRHVTTTSWCSMTSSDVALLCISGTCFEYVSVAARLYSQERATFSDSSTLWLYHSVFVLCFSQSFESM